MNTVLEQIANNGADPIEPDIWNGLPAPKSYSEIAKDPPARPEVLIKGLLYSGGKALGSAPSKGRKTWTALHMGACVASGRPWLGFETNQANVLILDLELLPHEAPERLQMIKDAASLWDDDGIFIQQLRGHRLSMDRIKLGIIQFCNEKGIRLIVIDPYYKLSGGADEIGTERVSEFLSDLDDIARQTKAAISITHHFSKGDSSQKSVIDLASGSGVFGRDPDLIWGMRELKDSTDDQPLVRMEFAIRSFKPVPPIGLRWEFPLWIRDNDLDLELKQPGKKKRGRPEEYKVEDIMKVLGNKELSVGEWGHLAGAEIGISKRQFNELKAKAKNDSLITEQKEGRYTLCEATRAKKDDCISASREPVQMPLPTQECTNA